MKSAWKRRSRFAAPIAILGGTALVLALTSASSSAQDDEPDCTGLPGHDDLQQAVATAVDQGGNGGLAFDMWATVVNRDGVVCHVAFSGSERGDQWPGSRIISAQKAHTANAFSQPADGRGGGPAELFQGLSLSTANLYSAVQPGGSLYGLQHSNPVDATTAYSGDHAAAGQANDPLVGEKVGGVNVFGGGVALYDGDDELVGALGVSGDTSCADHVIAWKMRDGFGLDNIPSGVLPNAVGGDNIIFDTQAGSPSPSGFGHPQCVPPSTVEAVLLPATHPLGEAETLPQDEVDALVAEFPDDLEPPVPQLDELIDDVGVDLPLPGK